MNNKLLLNVAVEKDDIIDSILQEDYAGVLDMIKRLDLMVADIGFTVDLAKYFIAEWIKFEEPEDVESGESVLDFVKEAYAENTQSQP